VFGVGEGALTPGAFEVLPGAAREPLVAVRVGLGAVLAELVDDGGAADDGFEAGGLAFDESGHLAAVAVADEGHLVYVNGFGVEDLVDAGHDVEIVAVAHVVFVGGFEGDAIAGAAAGVGDEHGPALAYEEIRQGRVAVEELAGGAAVDVDDEGDVCGGCLRREVEETFDGEAGALPGDGLRGGGGPCGWRGLGLEEAPGGLIESSGEVDGGGGGAGACHVDEALCVLGLAEV